MLGSRNLFSGLTLQNQGTVNVEGRLSETKGTRGAFVLWEPGMQNRKFTYFTVAFLQKRIKPLC